MKNLNQPTVRQINAHLNSGDSRYCYVRLANGEVMRITRARTRNGVAEGRVCAYNAPRVWEPLPADATIALTYY